MTSTRQSFITGTRAIAPLLVAALPFGLVYGVAVSQSSIADWQGGLASPLIVAGAAQFALIDLIDDNASWALAVGTALVINLRFAMYSGALAPSFSQFPTRWRVGLAFLMTDQIAVTSLIEYDRNSDPVHRRWFYLGAGVPFATVWVISTWLGITFGSDIPDSWELGLAVPIVFIGLLMPSINNRPSLVAATVGGSVALVTAPLPNGLNIIVGALAGVSAGLTVPANADEGTS
jgi:predicted branched-subunit amino acid permease